MVGFTPTTPEGDAALLQRSGTALDRSHLGARITAGETVCITDTEDRTQVDDAGRDVARVRGYRSMVVTPLRRESASIGVISVTRRILDNSRENQIELLETFADQAVIAIENVRLFTELTHKNAALTQAHEQVSEALERQTATSEVLRVISSSPHRCATGIRDDRGKPRRAYAVPNPRLCIGSMVKSFTLPPDITSARGARRLAAGFRVRFVKPITFGASWTAPCLKCPI